MGMEVLLKNAKIPGAHKIGGAVSGARIAGKGFYGHELSFSGISKDDSIGKEP